MNFESLDYDVSSSLLRFYFVVAPVNTSGSSFVISLFHANQSNQVGSVSQCECVFHHSANRNQILIIFGAPRAILNEHVVLSGNFSKVYKRELNKFRSEDVLRVWRPE